MIWAVIGLVSFVAAAAGTIGLVLESVRYHNQEK